MDNPVDAKIVDTLLKKFPDFEHAYTEKGLSHEEFDTFGSTRRTLRQFIVAGAELNGLFEMLFCPIPIRNKPLGGLENAPGRASSHPPDRGENRCSFIAAESYR
jgi:hypothetical protein